MEPLGVEKYPKIRWLCLLLYQPCFDSTDVKQPDRFWPERENQGSMIFGYGVHSCIGAPMARAFSTQIFKHLFLLRDLKPCKGRAGKIKRIGIFPDAIQMMWDQTDRHGDSQQFFSTICVPIKDSQAVPGLRTSLELLGNVACNSAEISSGDQNIVEAISLSDSIHFVSGCISEAHLEENKDGAQKEVEPSYLLFELSGDEEDVLLIEHLANAIESVVGDKVKAACGYSSSDTLASIFMSHRIRNIAPFNKNLGLEFNGAPGHGIRRIKAEAELSKVMHELVLGGQSLTETNSLERLDSIREKLAERGDLDWAFTPVRNRLSEPEVGLWKYLVDSAFKPWSLVLMAVIVFFTVVNFLVLGGFQTKVWMNLAHLGAAISMTVLGAVLLVSLVAGIVIVYLRRLEENDAADLILPDQANYDQVTSQENQLKHNHMFSVSRIKSGFIRTLLLRGVLWVVKLAAVYKNPPGILSVIDSIHFARWVRIPNTRQLVFYSNYGGSWESYLEDFITKGAAGLTSIWSNTLGFPRTQYLTKQGAKLSEPFKYWARRQQRPTPFWYVSYPNLTTNDIRRNANIREGFARINDVREADQWFSMFGSSPRPNASLDKSNIQSLVFGGMGKRLPHSKLLFVSFASERDDLSTKSLMRHLVERIDFGEKIERDYVSQIAFTYRGLQRLGLSSDDNRSFPNVFCQGSNSAARSRILGDLESSHPENWHWGSGEREVDFVLMCYFEKASQADANLAETRKLLNDAGAQVVWEQDCEVERNDDCDAVEPFGFVDGISQPIIKGTRRSQNSDQLDNIIAPGEVLCGYPDLRDNISPSPVVDISKDVFNVLPEEPFQLRQGVQKDFGFNGSFLVIRQLQQHVNAFNSFCETEAQELNETGKTDSVTPEWVGAKMLGRWKDGRPLVRFPSEHMKGDAENDFRYRTEDPQGLQCPLGAHVRRANPRDSLGDDAKVQMSLSNRHRILRVGRPYRRADADERGLMFMCLNSDIERQFEFVQQTWLGNTGFHGLTGEIDSISSGKCPMPKKFTIPTDQGGVTLKGLPSFVTTKGSAYFFLPGRQALTFLLNL